MRLENTVMIDAPADVVWGLTIDVAQWPSVTPKTMTRVSRLDDGPLRVGSQARIKQPGQSQAVWTVTHLEEGRQFTWQTKRMGLTMIGSHLIEDVDGGCRNTLALDVKGRGADLFGRIFGRLLRFSLESENIGFRTTAEQSTRSASGK